MPEKTSSEVKSPWLVILIVGLLLVLVFKLTVSITKFFQGGSSKNETQVTSEKDKDLIGEVRIGDAQFHVTNKEGRNWKSCRFLINDKYYYPTKTSEWVAGEKIQIIKSDETISVDSIDFAMTDGQRYNPYTIKPQSFSVSCENGLGFWGWK